MTSRQWIAVGILAGIFALVFALSVALMVIAGENDPEHDE